jgi:stage II sporulation protein P
VKFLKLKNKFATLISSFCAVLATSCFAFRTPSIFKTISCDLGVMAAKTVFSNGNSDSLAQDSLEENKNTNTGSSENENAQSGDNKPDSQSAKEQPDPEEAERHKNEKTYKITESQCKSGGEKYENFYFKNGTNHKINVLEELKKPLKIKVAKDGTPQVLIVHTHTSEAYMLKDYGFYYESYNPRSSNNARNVVAVGEEIKNGLMERGINTIHDQTPHDSPSYNGSYNRSAETIKGYLKEFPSINVVLDIHRDSMGGIKPTFLYNGEKAAQIMLLVGCDRNNSKDFPDWKENLSFALKLQKTAEDTFPNMTRPMTLEYVRYNMNLTPASLLIEVGTELNTVKEACTTGRLLAKSTAKVIDSLQEAD